MTRITIRTKGRTETHWFPFAHEARTWLLLNDYVPGANDTFEHISGRSAASLKVKKIHNLA